MVKFLFGDGVWRVFFLKVEDSYGSVRKSEEGILSSVQIWCGSCYFMSIESTEILHIM